jgi:hypothetical protein
LQLLGAKTNLFTRSFVGQDGKGSIPATPQGVESAGSIVVHDREAHGLRQLQSRWNLAGRAGI